MPNKEKVHELTSSEFSKFVKEEKIKDKLTIVDFYAEWCMPCLMMAPVMDGLAEKNEKVKFAKINVDDASDLANEYEVSSIPCIIFFKNGKEIDRIIGGVPEEAIEEKIDKYS